MTLQETVDSLKSIASQQPNIRTVQEGSIYDILCANPSVVYNAFIITQEQHRESEDYNYYSFDLFCVDRLTDDYSNRLQIQSITREVLSRIIRIFCDTHDIDMPDDTMLTYNTFTERFTDLTAGTYARVTFQIPVDLICGEEDEPQIEITSNGYYYINNTKIKVNVE